MKLNKIIALGVLTGAATSMEFEAFAATEINGTLGFIPVGNVTYSGAALGSSTSVSVPALELVNTIPPTFNGNPNGFLSFVAPGDLVTLAPLTIAPAGSETIIFDGFTLIVSGIAFSSAGAGDLHMEAFGTVSGNGFNTTPAEFSASFTQTSGGDGAVNGSFTLDASDRTIPPNSVPDTAGVAITLAPLGTLLLSRLIKRK